MAKKGKIESIQSLALDFVHEKNEKTFIKLIDRVKPGLQLYVKGFVGNDRDQVNEIVSQTFINIWEKIHQYNTKYNFSTWAYAIARNEAIGYLRQSKRNLSHEQLAANHSRTLKLYSGAFHIDIECMGPNNQEITTYLYDLTIKEINSLSEPYRTVMIQREVDKKQLHDIAEHLDWNLNTVKTRLRKARKEIANRLCKKYPEIIEAYNENEL